MPKNCQNDALASRSAKVAPLWAVVGPTASGKSSLAMALAERYGGEIVACDSIQVYRGFDIGSAKPSQADQARIQHHLIDVVAPQAPFDAKMYCERVEQALQDIAARHKVAVVCGGTGLYLRALRYGLVPTVAADAAFREQGLAQEAVRPGALFERLVLVDPASAHHIGPHNKVQLIRALEITRGAGEPASVVRARHFANRHVRPMVLIQPVWPCTQLRARMRARIAAMLQAGFVDEVSKLQREASGARGLAAVGYREVVQYLAGALPRQALPAAILKSTWAYSRRQRTWLRREAQVQPLPMRGDITDLSAAYELLQRRGI